MKKILEYEFSIKIKIERLYNQNKINFTKTENLVIFDVKIETRKYFFFY